MEWQFPYQSALPLFSPLYTGELLDFHSRIRKKTKLFPENQDDPEPNLGTFLHEREKILRITSSRKGHKSRSYSRNSTIILPLDNVKTWKNARFFGHFEHFGLQKSASASCSQIHHLQ
tara:strand:+ start:81 stop:434 length:354 start_codon:yes stop_codon:yes gene_type:complete